MPTLEDLFARYAATGELEALAEVFDRAAPQLLRIALHVARSESEAEDLLQATFVVAIERARRFDAGRPLLPWLTGILTNKARELLKHRQPPQVRGPLQITSLTPDPKPVDIALRELE